MGELPRAVTMLADRLAGSGWVSDLHVAGSLATGDFVPGVSDLDLVAVVSGPIDAVRRGWIAATHTDLDHLAATSKLGCVYIDEQRMVDVDVSHPTWTHGLMVDRIVSGVTRAELVRSGFAVFGRAPGDVWPAMTADDVRAAARAELGGYWAWAARRPWLWLDREYADLSLTSMARGRHSLRTGELLTKSRAANQAAAPGWLRDQVVARRRGEEVVSPRLLAGYISWRDTRRTLRAAKRAAGV